MRFAFYTRVRKIEKFASGTDVAQKTMERDAQRARCGDHQFTGLDFSSVSKAVFTMGVAPPPPPKKDVHKRKKAP